jgi:flavorubredoxin
MFKINDDIHWVGYIDWSLRNFHGYSTPSGTTYNAYLILDEKPTLIDTVKHYGFDGMLSKIREAIDPKEIRYIISNHTEMDHSGSIDRLLAYCPKAEVVCSPKGAEGLKKHFKKDWDFKIVQTGDSLDIGKRKLSFLLMPMVHWPDSMATYSANEAILFSNDAFGQHYASSQRYVDQVGLSLAVAEAEKYYANIVLPYGAQVIKALAAASTLTIDMICPSHGLIWRKKPDLATILDLYSRWAHYESEKKATIIYDTMWHSTEQIALRLYEILEGEGIDVKLIHLPVSDISDVVTEVMRSRVVLFGTPILNNRMLPTMGGLLTYLKGLKPSRRWGVTFGSYGWSQVGFKELEDFIKEAGIELIGEGKYFNFIPDPPGLDSLKSLGAEIKDILNKE